MASLKINIAEIIEMIKAEKPNLVEVVRCKDCKHRIKGPIGYECEFDTGDQYALGRNADNDEWYCADGEELE